MTPKSAETEARLFDCALTLLAAKGYSATSVRDIIEAAGVSKPVLYYYCDNKADLFAKLVRRTHEGAYTELERQLAETHQLANRLRLLIVGTFAFGARDWRLPRLMFQTAYGPRNTEVDGILEMYGTRRFGLVQRIMQEAQEAGELSTADDPAFLALAFCSLMDHPLNILSSSPETAKKLTAELAEALLGVFLRGLARD